MKIEHSPYLAQLSHLDSVQKARSEDAEAVLVSLQQLSTPLPPDAPALGETLRNLKARFDLAWASQRAESGADYQRLGYLRSEFARLCIDKALRQAWQDELAKQRVQAPPLEGVFILGLGKLGGDDLNFSSDVDLIAFYDRETLPLSTSKGKAYLVNRILQHMSKILQPDDPEHLIWRVDWRLRPERSSQGLAMATEPAQNFYFFRAMPWHRLALLKARFAGGDISCANEFLQILAPFIYRQNLDFSVIDEIAHLKKRINLEHPALTAERAQAKPIMSSAKGFNVKLGRGGIREIEFIANAFQLLWAGKDYALRAANTLTILDALAKSEHLLAEQAKQLSQAYQSLRHLEDAIQMIGNKQTHNIPDEAVEIEQIAGLLDVNWEEYEAKLYALRLYVSARFDQLFSASQDEKTKPDTPPLNMDALTSDRAREIANSWLAGFDDHGIRPAEFARFAPLGERCLSYVMSASSQPEEALMRVDRFLRTISRSDQYFRLLARNETILKALINPLLYSPHMSTLLRQSPHIIDIFLDPAGFIKHPESYKADPRFVLADDAYDVRLERLRRFVNENLFGYYHGFLEGQIDTPKLQIRLTNLAKTTLETALVIAKDNLGAPEMKVAILGLGKMGTARMAPLSDLDLVFIFADDTDMEQAAKLVRRLKTALTTALTEGIAYELDMRLRPSGHSGPAAVRLSRFIQYHDERAKTWEHIALASAASVAGDKQLCQKLDKAVADILDRPRDRNQCLKDGRLMWNRIESQRITTREPGIWDSKLREGGLMQAEYLAGLCRLLGQDASDMDSAIHFWSRGQIFERLFDLTAKPLSETPPDYQNRIFGGQLDNFKAQSAEHQAHIMARLDELIGNVTIEDDRREAPIIWR